MSRFARSAVGVCCAVWIAGVLVGNASEQLRSTEDRVPAALEFITEAFPELKRQDVWVQVSSTGRGLVDGYPRPFVEGFGVRVAESRDELLTPVQTSLAVEELYFHAAFRYDDRGLERLWINGRLVRMGDIRRIKRLSEEPTPEEAQRLATEDGLRVGPAERVALLEGLPLKALEALLGPTRVLGAEFAAHSYPMWSVEVERISDNARFLIYCEPFGRRIDSIYRRR